mgnify:CR=1 FL=1
MASAFAKASADTSAFVRLRRTSRGLALGYPLSSLRDSPVMPTAGYKPAAPAGSPAQSPAGRNARGAQRVGGAAGRSAGSVGGGTWTSWSLAARTREWGPGQWSRPRWSRWSRWSGRTGPGALSPGNVPRIGKGPSHMELIELRDFLARNQVPYRWYSSDEPEGQRLLDAAGADGAQHAAGAQVRGGHGAWSFTWRCSRRRRAG